MPWSLKKVNRTLEEGFREQRRKVKKVNKTLDEGFGKKRRKKSS